MVPSQKIFVTSRNLTSNALFNSYRWYFKIKSSKEKKKEFTLYFKVFSYFILGEFSFLKILNF